MSIWLAREKDANNSYIVFQGKPRRQQYTDGETLYFCSKTSLGYQLGTFCPEVLHRLSNIELEPGTMVRLKAVKFII